VATLKPFSLRPRPRRPAAFDEIEESDDEQQCGEYQASDVAGGIGTGRIDRMVGAKASYENEPGPENRDCSDDSVAHLRLL
jgi:hypothetical protein